MRRIDRRRLLQLSGAGAMAAGAGGIAAILASGRAPAFAQGTTLHWVRGSDYVPVSDQMLRTKINDQAQKDLGIKINLEGVDGLTIQARVTSAVSSVPQAAVIVFDVGGFDLHCRAKLVIDITLDINLPCEQFPNLRG